MKITKGKIADIEFLRGFGVVFVLLGHTNGSLIPWSSPLLENSALQHLLTGNPVRTEVYSGSVESGEFFQQLGSPSRLFCLPQHFSIGLVFFIHSRPIWTVPSRQFFSIITTTSLYAISIMIVVQIFTIGLSHLKSNSIYCCHFRSSIYENGYHMS